MLPCAGNGGNGERVIMLPKSSTPGAEGVLGASMGSPVWAGAYAFTLAVKARDGGVVARVTEIPMPLVTPENSKLCTKADRDELVKEDWKCTAVPLSVAPDNFYIDVFSKFIPQLDLYSALNGTVPEGQ
jgi:ribose transport system substrate-binding protein